MQGTRPLVNSEIQQVAECFDGIFGIRNRGLFMLGVSTGGRISELLSLKVGDVYQNSKPVSDLLFERSIVKGGEVSRVVPVNSDGRQAVSELITWHSERYGSIDTNHPLFPSRNGRKGLKAMNRQTAHDVLKRAYEMAGLNGKLATHSLRKSFAQRLYEQTSDIYMVQEMLGHRSVSTTQRYLGVNYTSAREACEAMSVFVEHDTTPKMSCSIDKASDEALLLTLVTRGYDVTKILKPEPDTPCEIIPIPAAVPA